MKLAIIETGGKQYVVAEGQKIEVEKLPQNQGDKFDFDKVLLIADGENVNVGKPYLSNKVSAELIEQKRAKKIKILRYHSKNRSRRRKGHRQSLSKVLITKI